VRPVLPLAIAAAGLSACMSLEDLNTDSGFVAPTTSGAFSNTLDGQVAGADQNAEGDGYSYRVGNGTNTGFLGHAGMIPGSDVSAAPASGAVSYAGTWEMAQITSIFVSGGMINGFTGTNSGSLTLTADFSSGAVSGGGDGLTIDGALRGTDLSGTVTYQGVDGSLDGLVGGDGAVGAFHGNSGDIIYAGGFLATPN